MKSTLFRWGVGENIFLVLLKKLSDLFLIYLACDKPKNFIGILSNINNIRVEKRKNNPGNRIPPL